MDSEILDQLTNLGRDVDSEFPKPKRGRRKKVDPKVNEVEDSDVRDKRERLVACVLSGNSKMYLGKEYTEAQINEMDCTNVNTLLNRYESFLSAQMTKSLGKSVINLLVARGLPRDTENIPVYWKNFTSGLSFTVSILGQHFWSALGSAFATSSSRHKGGYNSKISLSA